MGYKPQRLELFKQKVENFNTIRIRDKRVVVIWPHSHADMNDLKLHSNIKYRVDIAMPCCKKIPNNWLEKPHLHYKDFNVLSPKNDIYIWEKTYG